MCEDGATEHGGAGKPETAAIASRVDVNTIELCRLVSFTAIAQC